ncbi:MAG: GTP-binding protein [Blautia producta]|uniref:Cobalamin biosynthesis protein P47K n=2 Tax=Blautia producta TaxID=33035 RepID=A0A7G5N1L5_9FIRM|nr:MULTISPECIES: GTP-binding protein [Blautia]MDU5221905.1 GTP-binding protein [Blautia producta]MDU5383438.1 GTP-binding protein [Blautia producta]MDU6884657.1 GTP-binding protein [Blautia producta]QIB56467.1 GTP-binding protein [Blautia producta ATCC 27340 = DSM 2950]QMW80758.1 cobalamin biosynthesis protein P47K [Blautia producta]
MKVLILGGFLGSGKTTLLLSLARYLVDSSRSGSVYKVVILENEVGREGIDDKLLRGNGFNVENLFNGCACCTLAGELVSAAYEIEKEYAPDWLIVETTGLAYPGLIQDNLSAGIGMESRVCTVVDVSRWKRLMNAMRELFVGQTERADVVLMNKTDLVPEQVLNDVGKDIAKMNPDAVRIATSAVGHVEDYIWDVVLGVTENG